MDDYSIPLSVPSLEGNEWKYVKDCLDTEWVSSGGKYVELFEEKVAEYTGAKFAVACVNGTSALQVSLRLIGVEPGDEVIVPTLTFIAPVNAITYNGAKPVFMDSDKYYNIDVQKTIDFIENETVFKDGYSNNKNTKKRISAIIPVHVWGNACNLDELVQLCEERNIAVLEDASESLGTLYSSGKYKGEHTGTIGILGCLSFNGNKIITTGGGGMILTDNQKLADYAQYLTTQAKDDPVHYIHNEVGNNLRITNMQAALGLAQLEQLPKFLMRKKNIYRQYLHAIEKIEGLSMARVPEYSDNNHWLNLLQIEIKNYAKDCGTLMTHLATNGIQTRPVWTLNHRQKPYRECQNYKIEKAEIIKAKSLCLPSSSNLHDEDLAKIIKILS
jgi:perosamine synthetase